MFQLTDDDVIALRKHFVLVPNVYTYNNNLLYIFIVSFDHFLFNCCIFKQAAVVPIISYKKVNNKVY